MTADDRRFMVDVDDANLTAFLAWHRDAWDRGAFRGMSIYSQLKMAWMAAKSAPAEAPLPPSRDVLPPAPVEQLPRRLPLRQMTIPGAHPVQPRMPDKQDMDEMFAKVRLSGPQQAAMDRLYPLPAFSNTTKVWDGEPVRIEAPPTTPMRVVPIDFDPANLPVAGPVEDVHG